MATYIAFLRAINVGGRFAKMADLRTGLVHKGFAEVESYVQSGNLRFSSSLSATADVELAFENALEELCGFTVSTIVRTPAQMGELTRYGAGLTARVDGEPRRYVTLLKQDPDDDFLARMNGWDVPGEHTHVHGREVYFWLTHPFHQEKLTKAQIKRVGVVAATRDWKAISVLGQMWGH
jgi:uncharacterized protein (DUF1697 family)